MCGRGLPPSQIFATPPRHKPECTKRGSDYGTEKFHAAFSPFLLQRWCVCVPTSTHAPFGAFAVGAYSIRAPQPCQHVRRRCVVGSVASTTGGNNRLM